VKALVDDVTVAVPWAGRDPHREAALAWVTRQWVDEGFAAPSLGVPTGDTWVKAEAVAHAIAYSETPILAICDADVWSDGVHDAIARVRAGAPWAIPHNLVWRLSPEATRQVLDGTEPHEGLQLDPDEPTARKRQGYAGRPGGGIVVIRRDVYEDCPMDPRFQGWGHEDEAWALALTRLHGGPVRFGAHLWHLWHPPQLRLSRGLGSAENELLYRRYHKARNSPELMRRLVDEAKEVTACNR
jgi:hypothetical protein